MKERKRDKETSGEGREREEGGKGGEDWENWRRVGISKDGERKLALWLEEC